MGGGNSSMNEKYGQRHKHAQEGDIAPDVLLKFRIIDKSSGCNNECGKPVLVWKDIPTSDLFKGKRVVIFGVPGAFTPVCSCDHLPGYESNYDKIRSLGIDDVYCVSVNDAFVMQHWGIVQGLEEELGESSSPLNPGNFKRVKLIPDGAAKFSKAMGMTCRWDEKGGFGLRSWRYSAVINNMVIEKIFVEVEGNIQDDSPAGPEPLIVSDAPTMPFAIAPVKRLEGRRKEDKMRRIEMAVMTDEHRQPFSVLTSAKRYPGNIQLVGDTIETMDKTVGRIVYRSKGDVSSKNYLSVSNLDLVGPIFVLQLCLVEPLISTIHIEVLTSLQLPLRITLSTLYGKDPPTFLGRSMRLPLPSIYSWMNLVINVGDIIEQYCRYDRGQAQMRLGRIKKIDVCSNTIIRDIVSINNYSDVKQLKVLQVKPGVDVPIIMYEEFCRQFRSSSSSKQQAPPPLVPPSVNDNKNIEAVSLTASGVNQVTWQDSLTQQEPEGGPSGIAEEAMSVALPAPTAISPVPAPSLPSLTARNNNMNEYLWNNDGRSEMIALQKMTSSAVEQSIQQQEGVVVAQDHVDHDVSNVAEPPFFDNEKEDPIIADGQDEIDKNNVQSASSVDIEAIQKQEEAHRALEEEEERQKRLEMGELTEEEQVEEEKSSANLENAPVTPLNATKSMFSSTIYDEQSKPQTPPPKPVAGTEVKLQGNDRLVTMEMVTGYLSGPAALLYNSRMLVHSVGSFLIVTDLDRNSGNPGYEKPSFGLWKVFASYSNMNASTFFSSATDSTVNLAMPQTPSNIIPQTPTAVSNTGGLRQTLLKGHVNEIGLIEVSRNDTWMITVETAVDRDGLLIIWDLKNGSRIASLRPHPGRILAAAINQAETQIATAGLDHKNRYQIIVWDIAKLSQCQGVVVGHQLSATNKDANSVLAFSAIVAKQISDFDVSKLSFNRMDDSQLVSCGRENIRVWRIHRNHLPARPVLLNAYARNVQYTDITYDVSSKNIFVASDRGHVLKIQHPSLQVVAAYKLHDSGINCIHVQNACCVTGGRDRLLRVWPLDFNDFLLEARHEGSITCLAMQEDKGHRLVIGTDAGTLGILDLPHHRYETMVRSHHEPVVQVMERRSNDTIVTVGSDNTVRVWNSSGQQIVEFWSEFDAPSSVCDLSFSPNHLLAGFQSGFIRIFDIATAFCSLERKYSSSPITKLLFSTYMGRWVIASYANGLLHVLDYNDHLRLVYEYQSPLRSSSAANDSTTSKMKLSSAGDVLIHEFAGKVTVFDLPHLRILLDSFEVWPIKLGSISPAVPILGMEVIDKFDHQFLLIVGERLCKLYSFDVRRYDDVSEIRVLLHSQMSFSGTGNEANTLQWNALNHVKIIPDVSLMAFILKTTTTSSDKSNKDCCVFFAKYDITCVEVSTKTKDSVQTATNMTENFSIAITKPQPQTILSTIVYDVAWSAARRQLVTATMAGYLAFWRIHPFQMSNNAGRSATAMNLFGGSEGLYAPSPTSLTGSPLAQQQLRQQQKSLEAKKTRQVIETQGQHDVVRINTTSIVQGGDNNNNVVSVADEDDDYMSSKRGLRQEDLLVAEDHRSVVNFNAPVAAEQGPSAKDNQSEDDGIDIEDASHNNHAHEAKILDISGTFEDVREADQAHFDALWQDNFAQNAPVETSAIKPHLTKKKTSKLNASFGTSVSGHSRKRKTVSSSSVLTEAAVVEGLYVQGDCFQPLLSHPDRSVASAKNKGKEVEMPTPAAVPPLSSLFSNIQKHCLVWNEDFAMVSDSESISLCLFATNQRIVLTKADISMPYSIRRVWRLYMAPLHSHMDAQTDCVVHTHSVLMVVSDVFDTVHHLLWSWSHVGSSSTAPVATLPQSTSLDTVIPPYPLLSQVHSDGVSAGREYRLGHTVWLSEQRFAIVNLRDKQQQHTSSVCDRDMLVTLEIRVFRFVAPHFSQSRSASVMSVGPTLTAPTATLERTQLLEIPGHTLFGVNNVNVDQVLIDSQDYLVFSTGYCCVMMELPRKTVDSLATIDAHVQQPRVWLNDVKNRGNFLAMTAKGVRIPRASAVSASASPTFAILAAVNHAAELHITLFQQPIASRDINNHIVDNGFGTKLMGRSTVCSLPSVNHLGVDPLHLANVPSSSQNTTVFTALELIESPQHKQYHKPSTSSSAAPPQKLAYQLFLMEHNVVRVYDLQVTEMGTKNSSIRASLHGLRKLSLEFVPCQVFSNNAVFANCVASKRRLVIMGNKGQVGYVEEVHSHSPAPSSTSATMSSSSAVMGSSSNAGVSLKYVSLIAAAPAGVSSTQQYCSPVETCLSPESVVVREMSGDKLLLFVPQMKSSSIESASVYSLPDSDGFDSFVNLVRLSPSTRHNHINKNSSLWLMSYSDRQRVLVFSRPDDTLLHLVLVSSMDMLHTKQLHLLYLTPSSGNIVRSHNAHNKQSSAHAVPLRRHSLVSAISSKSSQVKKNSNSNVKRGVTDKVVSQKNNHSKTQNNVHCKVRQLVVLGGDTARHATLVVAATVEGLTEEFVGFVKVNCDARDDTSVSAVSLYTLPRPYNPDRPYFYDGNLDDEGSVSSDDSEAGGKDGNTGGAHPSHGMNSATSALLNTNNAQQTRTLLVACEYEEISFANNHVHTQEEEVVGHSVLGVLRKESAVLEMYHPSMTNKNETDNEQDTAELVLCGLNRLCVAVSGEAVQDAVHSAYFPQSQAQIIKQFTVPVVAEYLHFMNLNVSEMSPFIEEMDEEEEDRMWRLKLHRHHRQTLLCVLGRMNLQQSPGHSHLDTYGNILSLFVAVVTHRQPVATPVEKDSNKQNQEENGEENEEETVLPPVQLSSTVLMQRLLVGDSLRHFSFCEHFVALLHPHALYIVDLRQFSANHALHHHHHHHDDNSYAGGTKNHLSGLQQQNNDHSKNETPSTERVVTNLETSACKTLLPTQVSLCEGDWSKGVTVTLYRETHLAEEFAVLFHFAGRRMERVFLGKL